MCMGYEYENKCVCIECAIVRVLIVALDILATIFVAIVVINGRCYR